MTIFFHSTLPESPEEIPRHVFQRCVVSASWFWKPSEKFGDSSHIRSRVAIYLQLPKCHRGTNYNPDFDLILFSIDECQREVFGLSLEISAEGQWEIRKNGGLFTLQIAFLLISGFEVSPSRVHGSVFVRLTWEDLSSLFTVLSMSTEEKLPPPRATISLRSIFPEQPLACLL